MNQVLRDLIKVIDIHGTIRLCRKWGGWDLYIPAEIKWNSPLVIALGWGQAQAVVEHFGGQQIEIPAEFDFLIKIRNEMIVAEAAQGDPLYKIALRYGMRRQNVKHIIKKHYELEEIRKKYSATKRPLIDEWMQMDLALENNMTVTG